MPSVRENSHVMIKLGDGEDLLPSLEDIAREHSIKWGVFLTGVGMLRDFEIGYWAGDGYLTAAHADPHEVLHYGGSIAEVDGRPAFHIHATLAARDHRVIGGHLLKGTVAVLNEMCILRFNDTPLTRKLNPGSGLMELELP